LLIALFVPALAAGQGSICDPCVDGPEMLRPRRQEAAAPIVVTIRCEVGPVQRTFAGTDWLVSECDSGWLEVVAAAKNPVWPTSFTVWPVGDRYELEGLRPRGRIARAAYRELLSLPATEIKALLVEVRASAE